VYRTKNRLIEELTPTVLSETSVPTNAIGPNTVYDDHFIMKSSVGVRYDGSVVVE